MDMCGPLMKDMEMEVNRFVWCLLEGKRLDLLY